MKECSNVCSVVKYYIDAIFRHLRMYLFDYSSCSSNINSHSLKYPEKLITFSKSKLNKEYDDVFLMNNDKYYCSELIYEAFSKDSIFQLQPMTFLHPETKDTLVTWKEYYSEIGVEIPQNKLGINPGIMSLSNKIEIVHKYGIPDRMKK